MKKRPTLSLDAQKIDTGTWYYETPRGLHVIRYHADTGAGPERFYLPWRKIETSVKRYQTRKRARKSP